MKRIALLRSNPKDAAILKIIDWLSTSFHIDCLIWDRNGDFRPSFEKNNINYVKCRLPAGFHDIKTFIKLFLFQAWLFFRLVVMGVDAIHAVDLDTGVVGFIAARLRGKFFVYQCLDPYYAALPSNWPKFLAFLARKLENFIISHADLFIITDRLRLPQHEGSHPKKIIEIPNIPNGSPPDREPESGQAERFVVGYIGSLTDGRNLATLVEAVGELAQHGVDLIIGGFGPFEDRIRNLALKYPNITFTSWVPYENLLKIESSFDLFVQILDPENEKVKWGSASPNKLFESMAFGKPILVGAGTLTEKKIATIGNGVAVSYGAQEELKKAILKFRCNPELAAEMGAKGRSDYERNWHPERMKRILLDAYRSLFGDADQKFSSD